MSEFKFACPVCGQHMAADSGSTGLQIECPTCFQPILVPRPPTADSKYVLSATQPIKPHPPSASVPAPPAAIPRRNAMLVAACAVAFAALVFGGLLGFRTLRTRLGSDEPPAGRQADWAMELHERPFPDRTASGEINGQPFACERAVLQGGLLTLREGQTGIPGLAVTISLFARQPEELERKSFNIGTNDTGAPHVVLRWMSDQGQPMTRTFMGGYAMKLEFGQSSPAGMAAKIYLCLPDEKRSFVAGSFNAELRRTSAPRPRSPDRRS